MEKPKNNAPDPKSAETALVHESRKLMGECREAIIVHNGERYRLRITANDRLILTK